MPSTSKLKSVPLDMINEPSKELRSFMRRENLEELAASIKRYGVINPITVKQTGERYEIIAGHRRFLASQIAGKVDIPAIVKEGNDEVDVALTLEENIQREDVNAMDIARYLLYFIKEKGETVKGLAQKFNKSTDWVNLQLRLLECDPMAQEAVAAGVLPYASALELQKIDNPEHRDTLTRSAIEGGASHRTIKSWVQSYQSQQEFHNKVATGEYVTPSTSPPDPLKFKCFLCGRRHDNNDMITVRVGSECYQVLQELQRIAVKEGLVKTEDKTTPPEYRNEPAGDGIDHRAQ